MQPGATIATKLATIRRMAPDLTAGSQIAILRRECNLMLQMQWWASVAMIICVPWMIESELSNRRRRRVLISMSFGARVFAVMRSDLVGVPRSVRLIKRFRYLTGFYVKGLTY